MTLEQIFNELEWELKFKYQVPAGIVVRSFRTGSERDAVRFFERAQEETMKGVRKAFLFEDSLGQVLIVTETPWGAE